MNILETGKDGIYEYLFIDLFNFVKRKKREVEKEWKWCLAEKEIMDFDKVGFGFRDSYVVGFFFVF